MAHFWLRPSNTACVSNAVNFLGDTLARLPAHVRIALVRADSGFCTHGMIAELERRGLHYVMTAALRAPVRTLCCHDDAAWTPTEVPGIEVQDLTRDGIRLVVLRQRTADRPHGGGKRVVEICKDKNISEGFSRPAAGGCTDREVTGANPGAVRTSSAMLQGRAQRSHGRVSPVHWKIGARNVGGRIAEQKRDGAAEVGVIGHAAQACMR